MRIVVAIGGNAILPAEGIQDFGEEIDRVERTAEKLADIISQGHEVVITHGNGPQIGNMILQEEATPPELPLDVDVAQTQGQIGYLIQRELGRKLKDSIEDRPVTLLTQTVVETDSEEFENPSKPVGPFYSEEEAENKAGTIKKVGNGDKPFRRVVPSPRPLDIREKEQVGALLDRGNTVIACGGGGIPVNEEGKGVEAVVDKDRASAMLAKFIDSDMLVILTDVEYAYRNFGSEDQEAVEDADPSVIKDMLSNDEFEEGSMRPKIESAVEFVESTGRKAVIGSLENALEAIKGKGTVIRPEE
ncbi:MAG: carbamate kinase [Candidatus Nanohaloarchaea archaeon]|nr:carbamate kinase [Candidatus Nanohaloarchaea archaeon]